MAIPLLPVVVLSELVLLPVFDLVVVVVAVAVTVVVVFVVLLNCCNSRGSCFRFESDSRHFGQRRGGRRCSCCRYHCHAETQTAVS